MFLFVKKVLLSVILFQNCFRFKFNFLFPKSNFFNVLLLLMGHKTFYYFNIYSSQNVIYITIVY